jgi:ABC-type sugar transport system permease subunit
MLESLPALTSLVAVIAYVQFKKQRAFGWLVVSAIFLGLTAASKYLFAFVGFAILIDWYTVAKRNNNLNHYFQNFILFTLLSLFIFFATNPYLWPDPLGRLQESLFANTSYSENAQEVQNVGFPFWQPFNWLFFSVRTWHPTQFLFVVDVWITLLAFLGIGRLWKREPVYVWWLVIMMGFLLIWPTKWPQYIVALSAPLSLAAGEGVLVLWHGVRDWWKERKTTHPNVKTVSDVRRTLPWLVPGLIAFAVLTLFPLIFQFAVSLTDFNSSSIRDGFQGGIWRAVWGGLTGQVPVTQVDIGTRSNQVNYIGLGAYPAVFSFISGSPDGWSILFFNIMWTILSVLLQGALGLGVALLLWQRGVRFSKFWQAFFILPWAIPEMIGATMWLNVFQRDWGWLSLAADKYGPDSLFGSLEALSLSSPSFWLVTFLIPAVWYGFPFMMLAASVGLKAIPRHVFDAAAIDGANIFQTFRYITWPLLLPLLLPAVIIRGIFAFNQFYLFQVFFFQEATLATLSYNVFNPSGFNSSGQFAISATINIIAVIILIGFIVLFNRWSKAEEGVSYA